MRRAAAARWPYPLAAGLILLDAVIHYWVAPHHFAEATLFGAFMVVAGLAESTAAVLLIVRPTPRVIGGTMLGTLALIGIFVVAYTAGLPFGPNPGEPEELEPLGIASKSVEVLLMPVLAYLYHYYHVTQRTLPRQRPLREASS